MSLLTKNKSAVALLLLVSLLLSGCGVTQTPAAEEAGQEVSAPPASETAAPAAPATPEPAQESLRISELMAKNRAVLQDGDGDFSDWIEVENFGDTDVSLDGFSLSEKEGREGLALSGSLAPGEYRIFWASGKDRPEDGHAAFSLSEGETVRLIDPYGRAISSAPCLTGTDNASVALGEDGEYAECLWTTPGFPNTKDGYDAWQETLETPESPLLIQEICVYNTGNAAAWRLFDSDWVEIKNVSEGALELSDYCLSDDADDYTLWRFPQKQLMPGASYLVRCDDLSAQAYQGDPCTGFSLDAGSDQLFLSTADGTLLDWVALRNLPFGGTMGRVEDEAGWFYFAMPSPAASNANGYRRVSDRPTALTPDGVYDGVEEVSVALGAEGMIFYTLGDAVPTTESEHYEAPFEVDRTTVVRAIAVEEGALPSRQTAFTYIVNEGHSLPVLSLVADSRQQFVWMYSGGNKFKEEPATLSLYEENGGFSIPCGVRMHGETSLTLDKKNMSVRFRSAYGSKRLQYDVYGGGVDSFRSLVLRAGQDYYATVVKNAACQNLCLQAGNRAVTGRSKFCVLYVNGEYLGIYNLMEKTNEQLYADTLGVSADSVEVIESMAPDNSSIARDVFDYCKTHDLSVPEYYEHIQSLVDIDSVIDWIALEGYCANTDLTYGNVRYAHSTEGDGKWRLMFYDLDATFWDRTVAYTNMFDGLALYSRQVGSCLIRPLLQNPDFRDRMLRRFGELFDTVLSGENVMAEFDRLAAQVEPEIERDYLTHGMQKSKWEFDLSYLKEKFADDSWNRHCVNQICQWLQLTDEERAEYFGE